MRSRGEQNNKVTSLDAKRQEKLGIPQPVDLGKERNERRKWPVMKRKTAGWLLTAAGVLTAVGIGQALENQNRDELFQNKAAEMQSERDSMTPQEAAEHGRQEAVEQNRQKQAYEQAERPDEMNAGVRAERNGSEAAIEIGSPTSTVNPEEASNN